MSVVNEVRSALQDLVAPELRELKARVDSLEKEMNRRFDEMDNAMGRRFDHLETLLSLNAGITRLETIAAKEPHKQ